MFRVLFVWLAMSAGASAGETLIAFTARWCGPCKQFHRDFVDHPDMAGDRQVRLVDVDDSRQEARRYGVRSMPTFVLERDGREIRRTSGYNGQERLKAWLAGH